MPLCTIRIRQQLQVYVLISRMIRHVGSSHAIIVLLKSSACPFVCQWYAVVVRCFGAEKVQWNLQDLLINWVLIPVERCSRIPYGIIRLFRNSTTICDAVVLDVRSTLANFDYLSAMPVQIFSAWRLQKFSKNVYHNKFQGHLAENICRGHRHFWEVIFRDHSGNWIIVI